MNTLTFNMRIASENSTRRRQFRIGERNRRSGDDLLNGRILERYSEQIKRISCSHLRERTSREFRLQMSQHGRGVVPTPTQQNPTEVDCQSEGVFSSSKTSLQVAPRLEHS